MASNMDKGWLYSQRGIMTIRETIEETEKKTLSPYAAFPQSQEGGRGKKMRMIFVPCFKGTGTGFFIQSPSEG